MSADWTRRNGSLEITLDDGEVMTDPEWVRAIARTDEWSEMGLRSALADEDGAGLAFDDFIQRASHLSSL